MTAPASPADYESFVAQCFREAGWKVEFPESKTQEAWDFAVITPEGKRGAVQVKSRRAGALPHPVFNRLSLYLSGPEGALLFDFGVNVVNTNFSASTLAVLEHVEPDADDRYVYAAVVRFPINSVEWVVQTPPGLAVMPLSIPEPIPPQVPEVQAYRVAIFTEKGGVGKTSVAAHLAGALVHAGHNAVLIDVDKQKNLSLLLGDGVNIVDKRGRASTLVVERYGEVEELKEYKDFFMIYDCAPHFDANPTDVFQKVSDTVIPVVLSPLSILGNAEVVTRTIHSIRTVNPNMRFHIVVNQYEQTKASSGPQRTLLNYLRHALKVGGLTSDPKVKFYEPDELSIRRSALLLNWGIFLLKTGESPRLAFDSRISGAQNLLSDFVALATIIEEEMRD